MNKTIRVIVTILLWAISAVIFYLAFWKFAPYLSSLVPASNWKPIFDVGMYILVAWLGGLGLPIAMIWIGTIFIWTR